MRRVLAAGVLVALSISCGGSLQERTGDPRAEFARESLALLLARDLDRLRERFSPELVRLAPPEVLARVLAEIPPGVPSEPMLVGFAETRFLRGRSSAVVTWQFRFPSGYLLGRVQLDTSGARPVITALHLQPIPDSIDRINAFGRVRRTWRHHLVLALVVAVPAFILVSIVACLRTRGLRRKWLWVPLMLVGVCAIRLNWTTGRVDWRPTRIQVLGTGFTRAGLYMPWTLTAAVPVGAILFWLVRRRLRAAVPPEVVSAFE